MLSPFFPMLFVIPLFYEKHNPLLPLFFLPQKPYSRVGKRGVERAHRHLVEPPRDDDAEEYARRIHAREGDDHEYDGVQKLRPKIGEERAEPETARAPAFAEKEK